MIPLFLPKTIRNPGFEINQFLCTELLLHGRYDSCDRGGAGRQHKVLRAAQRSSDIYVLYRIFPARRRDWHLWIYGPGQAFGLLTDINCNQFICVIRIYYLPSFYTTLYQVAKKKIDHKNQPLCIPGTTGLYTYKKISRQYIYSLLPAGVYLHGPPLSALFL